MNLLHKNLKALFCPCGMIALQDVVQLLQAAPACIELCPMKICATPAELKCLEKNNPCVLKKIKGSCITIIGGYTLNDKKFICYLSKKYRFYVSFFEAERLQIYQNICKKNPCCPSFDPCQKTRCLQKGVYAWDPCFL